MTQATTPVKKRAVSGSIDPRWPKPKVVRWLEVGAVPAIKPGFRPWSPMREP